ncbi:PHD finger protein 11-like isoform X3 [Clinocottus analis]|uniref:PHD finger protein 11-like isoform X3 n=1 Tax=Clinocottus analis TaxID=304258 RepID=UPI0035C0A55F
MDGSHTVRCALCLRREETEATGPLSTKDDVTAHQNCLLFSSGLYCRHSPQFDDLFGFTVKDVLAEVKRGSKLICNKCKKKGATAGCENKRCKKSYHYPCAVKDGAKNVEDAEHGKYGLFCSYHHQMTQRHSFPVNGGASTSKSASEAGSSKSIANGDRTAAGRPAVYNSDYDSCSIGTRPSVKRKLNFKHKEGGPIKRKVRALIEEETDDSSNPDEDSESDMGAFAPIDTDFAESATSVPETQVRLFLFIMTSSREEEDIQ